MYQVSCFYHKVHDSALIMPLSAGLYNINDVKAHHHTSFTMLLVTIQMVLVVVTGLLSPQVVSRFAGE